MYSSYSASYRDGQKAVNEAVEDTIGYGLAETGPLGEAAPGRRRTRRFLMGRQLLGRRRKGIAGQRRRSMTNVERQEERLRMKGAAVSLERFEMLQKYALFANNEVYMNDKTNKNRLERFNLLKKLAEEVTETTNNHMNDDNSELSKRADESSKAYYKDAVTDLSNSDQYLRSYFTGLGRLYDEKAETPKRDYETLYSVHDETGVDLIHSAHPKAIVVSDSIGRGGLVENGLEQKRQTHGVALSAPTGNYRANYAWVRNMLEKKSSN